MASPQRWNHARERGGGGGVEQKFRDLMQISSSSANKIHRRRCKASQNLRLPVPTLSFSTYVRPFPFFFIVSFLTRHRAVNSNRILLLLLLSSFSRLGIYKSGR